VEGGFIMDRREAAALDRHITGNYGEDQFKGPDNDECNWKIGDIWRTKAHESYILCMTNDPDRKYRVYVQFVNIKTGNRYSEYVFVPDRKKWNMIVPIKEVCEMIFGRDISISTTDEDNLTFDELECCHEYGPEW
jgi:hypothetical protein